MELSQVRDFFDGFIEAHSGYWLFDQEQQQVLSHYPWSQAFAQQQSLDDWLASLEQDSQQQLQQHLDGELQEKQPFECTFAHQPGLKLRLKAMPLALNLNRYWLASVRPLNPPAEPKVDPLRDPSSGILSSALFRELLLQAMRLSQRNNEPFALLSIRYQAKEKDLTGTVIGKTLLQQLRRSDSVSRFAEDEFIILLYGAKRSVTGVIHDKLSERLQARLVELDIDSIQLAWSYFPEHGENVDTLLANRMHSAVYL